MNSDVTPQSDATGSPLPENGQTATRYLLWIDGVGTWLVLWNNQIVVGGPGSDDRRADVALLADLTRRHATIIREGESYRLLAHAPTRVSGRTVPDQTWLNDRYEIGLGRNVRLRFHLPSVLSSTAVLRFESDHRPERALDGVILMEDTCLLGPGSGQHICCRDWPESLVLFRRENRFFCKSRVALSSAGRLIDEHSPLQVGNVVSGTGISFRLEAIP